MSQVQDEITALVNAIDILVFDKGITYGCILNSLIEYYNVDIKDFMRDTQINRISLNNILIGEFNPTRSFKRGMIIHLVLAHNLETEDIKHSVIKLMGAM